MTGTSSDRFLRNEVGVVGLGRMGTPVALTLKRKGFNVTATSRSKANRETIVSAGIRLVESPADVAKVASIILISVFDAFALTSVISGPSGVLESLSNGTIVIDIGTSDIDTTRRLASEVEAAGCYYIDAPVSGGTRGAERGQLTIMAGGASASIADARPVLSALGRLNHMGVIGAGQSTKAVNQLILGQTLVAVAEGLALAAKLGLDQACVREALLGGFAESRVLIEHGRRMVERDFAPGGSVAIFSKDLEMVNRIAVESGLELQGLENARNVYQMAKENGMEKMDQSAIYELFEGKRP